MEIKLQSKSPEETYNLGKKIGSLLDEIKIICLFGQLGAGKTILAKGLAEALEVKEPVTSPTFTMINEYVGRLNNMDISFIHMDLYRLRNAEEAEIIGVLDYFREDCVCLLEWPEVIGEIMPEDRIEIYLSGSGEEIRDIIIKADKQTCEGIKA